MMLKGGIAMKYDKDNFLGGIFDFNGDGKTDIFEVNLGFKIIEE